LSRALIWITPKEDVIQMLLGPDIGSTTPAATDSEKELSFPVARTQSFNREGLTLKRTRLAAYFA